MKPITYSEITQPKGYWAVLGIFGLLLVIGVISFFYMHHYGHYVTGMNNQVVWGVPHVFAIFLIIAASGALNIASIASVFNKKAYKPLSRISGVLSLSLLTGGLAVLLFDLGRLDHVMATVYTPNFKSIFAWNIYLYVGLFAIVIVYLFTQMSNGLQKFTPIAGRAAFIWRLLLTMGTGSIFGFLVGRQAYDAAIFAPMFIIMSFSFGKAIFLLVTLGIFKGSKRDISLELITRLRNLFGVFIAAVLFFVLIYSLANLYATEHHGYMNFLLVDGGIYTTIFWVGQIIIGGIIPLVLIYGPLCRKSIKTLVLAAKLVIVGGISQLYVLLIGGQAYPLVLFPNSEVSSSFNDGVVASYNPTLAEFGLGLGGIGLAIGLFLFIAKIMPIVPDNLSNDYIDPKS